MAMGVYSSIRFGTFIGFATGGYAYERRGVAGIVIVDVVLLVIGLIVRDAATGGAQRARLTKVDSATFDEQNVPTLTGGT